MYQNIVRKSSKNGAKNRHFLGVQILTLPHSKRHPDINKRMIIPTCTTTTTKFEHLDHYVFVYPASWIFQRQSSEIRTEPNGNKIQPTHIHDCLFTIYSPLICLAACEWYHRLARIEGAIGVLCPTCERQRGCVIRRIPTFS